jgi:L-threonylcarbamoyladenylate synthase
MVYDCGDPEQRAEAIAAAVDAARRGEVVVYPADAFYGLAVDAFQPTATHTVMRLKDRSRGVPLPVLIGSWRALDGVAMMVAPAVRDLVEAFWPGALTLLVEHAPSLAWDLGDTRGTVAVRMPLHPVALEVLAEVGPMAVTTTNRAGQPPATTAEAAREQLGYAVAVYLDAGPAHQTVPSTIVDATGPVPRLVRAGAVTLEQLREVVPALAEREQAAPP